jgi:hypothetical protein
MMGKLSRWTECTVDYARDVFLGDLFGAFGHKMGELGTEGCCTQKNLRALVRNRRRRRCCLISVVRIPPNESSRHVILLFIDPRQFEREEQQSTQHQWMSTSGESTSMPMTRMSCWRQNYVILTLVGPNKPWRTRRQRPLQ